MAELRPSVFYALLVMGAILSGVGLIYGLFSDSEKREGNRYENSYVEFEERPLTERQQQALAMLKHNNIEWAHFRFVEAIKNGDIAMVKAFIDLGMALNSSSILLEIALNKTVSKIDMFALLDKHYALDFNALYQLPHYVNDMNDELTAIAFSYVEDKKEEHQVAIAKYNKSLVVWKRALKKKEAEMLRMCTNDACRSGRINDARRMFSESKPEEPKEDYLAKERVYLSLLTLFAWQKDMALLQFVKQNGAELIPNKLFLTDGKLIYFTVDESGKSTVIKP